MVICFDCDAKTKTVLDELLASDQFRDYSEVISTALANLAILRKSVPKAGSAVIHGGEEAAVDRSGAHRPKDLPAATQVKTGHVPALFRLDHFPNQPPVFGEIRVERWEREPKVPVAKWVFGQYNKLLPAKVTCRSLAHLIGEKPNGIPLSKVAGLISEEAAVLGDFLAAHDLRHGLRREDALQSGFPRTTLSGGVRVANSGQVRFANQFVAGESGKTDVSSLPIALKLVSCAGPERLLRLTEPGWKFAGFRNPVLEGFQGSPSQKFSKEEIEFFLSHVAQNVPIELFTYRTLLAGIDSDANTPEALNGWLQELDIWWKGRAPKDKASFSESQRSGAISRMADLELLQRERHGTRVIYRLTPSGQHFLKVTKPTKR